jgi:hypothetical protein
VIGGALALVIGNSLSRASRSRVAAVPVPAQQQPIAQSVRHSSSISRPVVRYSVVPGGVYDSRDVAAAKANDPVVASHYEDIVPAALTPTAVDHDRLVYASYRKNGHVYWTRNKVLLHSGETILSDGTREIRSRCGNRISMFPLLPVEDDEPTALELDALIDDEAEPVPGTVQASSPLVAQASTPAGLFAPPAGGPGFVPTTTPSTSGPVTDEQGSAVLPAGTIPIGSVPNLFPTLAGPAVGNNVTPPTMQTAPTGSEPVQNPQDSQAPSDVPPPSLPKTKNVTGGPTEGPRFPPPSDDQPPTRLVTVTPEDPFPGSPDEPPQLVPVPEPGTLLLVGGGAVSLALKRFRRRRRAPERVDYQPA